MLKKNNSLLSPDRLRRATWLPLLALAWLQLTQAAHQFDHVDDYAADSCEICVQLDRIDDSSVDQLPSGAVLPTSVDLHAATGQAVLPSRSQPGFKSRAPPRR